MKLLSFHLMPRTGKCELCEEDLVLFYAVFETKKNIGTMQLCRQCAESFKE